MNKECSNGKQLNIVGEKKWGEFKRLTVSSNYEREKEKKGERERREREKEREREGNYSSV